MAATLEICIFTPCWYSQNMCFGSLNIFWFCCWLVINLPTWGQECLLLEFYIGKWFGSPCTCIFSYFGVCVHVAKEAKTSLLIAVCYYSYLWLTPITKSSIMYSHEKRKKWITFRPKWGQERQPWSFQTCSPFVMSKPIF